MEIEGYLYAYDLSEEEAQALLLTHRVYATTGNDAMWQYMTTGIIKEENTDGRQETTDQDTNSR